MGSATLTFIKPGNNYQLEFCEEKLYFNTKSCLVTDIIGISSAVHQVSNSGVFFIRIIPKKASNDEIKVVLQNGNFYNDTRRVYVLIEQVIIIVLILIILIVYSKNMSGHFKKLNGFAVIAGFLFIAFQAVIATNDLIIDFTNTGFLFHWAYEILNLVSYVGILITLAVYSGATTFSGLEFSYERSICLIIDVVFIIAVFFSVFMFHNNFAVECSLLVSFSLIAIFVAAFLRRKTKRDYLTTFDMAFPKEINGISTKSFVTLTVMLVLYDTIELVEHCFDDFYYPKTLIANALFFFGMIFIYWFTNTRLDLIILNQPLVSEN